jgi:Protein of unknown function (DUF3617)
MTNRVIPYLVATTVCLSLASFAVIAAQAQRAGDLWEVVSQPSMAGLPFQLPAQSSRVCWARQWSRPPSGSGPDPTCVNSGFVMPNNTANWTTTCQNPPATGVGQITRTGDNFTGSIALTSAAGAMTISLTGRRVDGCDNPVQ